MHISEAECLAYQAAHEIGPLSYVSEYTHLDGSVCTQPPHPNYTYGRSVTPRAQCTCCPVYGAHPAPKRTKLTFTHINPQHR